jgi:Bul1 C terminus
VYKFPFTFVVPDRLLPQVCNHFTHNPHLKAAHMQLPPSFGDSMVCDIGKALLDDMAPIMSEIGYKITASVLKRSATNTTKPFYPLSAKAKKVRIIPATIEQPPLEVACNHTDDYRTRREKHIRKALLGSKTGRLVVTAAQPKPLQLSAPGTTEDAVSSNSHVKLHVRFDPENDDEQPPRLKSILSKLKVLTYSSSKPWTTFPSKNLVTTYENSRQGLCSVYTETVGLSSLCVVSAQWTKHDGTGLDDPGRCSLESDSSDESLVYQLASSSYSGKSFYTASILVPVSLPTTKTLVPTFHSCLVSRVYSLDLSLTYQSKPLTPSISLKIPIQITSAPGKGISPNEDTAMLPETQIEDEYYRPRNIAPPSEDDYLDRYQFLPESTSSSPSSSAIDLDDVDYDNAPPEYSTVLPLRVRTSNPLSPAWAIRALY